MAMNEKPKILIADDSEINRALLKEMISAMKEKPVHMILISSLLPLT